MNPAEVLKLLAIASQFSGLPIPKDVPPPVVSEEPVVQFSKDACGPDTLPQMCTVLGYFDEDEGHTLHINYEWTAMFPQFNINESDIVVHEATHWLQLHDKYVPGESCEAHMAREAQAYKVAAKYMIEVEHKPASDAPEGPPPDICSDDGLFTVEPTLTD